MATVTGMTADAMQAIAGQSVVSGEIDSNGDLILTTRNGTEINAGQAKGPKGDDATALLLPGDTETVDLTRTGLGTPEDPWLLKADVIAIPDGAMIKGILDPNYMGYGPAKVKINGVLSTTAYEWLTPYNPSASRTVRLMKTGSTYLITGQTQEGYYDLMQSINAASWTTYLDSAGNGVFNEKIRAIKLPSGLVVLSGLLRGKGALANGSVIATLPPGYAPDNDLPIAVEMNDQSLNITVKANGDIVVGANFVASGYLTLDGVAFWSAGVAQWIDFGSAGSSWGANFDYDPTWSATYGTPGFWKDPYGFVWFRGLVRLKGAGADNQPILNMPPGYLPVAGRAQHLRTTSNNAFGLIGTINGASLAWKTGGAATAGSWISLNGVCFPTAEAYANNPWYTPTTLVNSWANYSPGNYATLAIVRREDGLCTTTGLMTAGTAGSRMFTLARTEYWPSGARIILPAVAVNARARIDISGFRELSSGYEPGGFGMVQGSNSWFAVDSKFWVP